MEVLTSGYLGVDPCIVFSNLENTQKIILTEYEDAKASITWCCGSRWGRNSFRVGFAGSLSFAGSIFAGLIATTGSFAVGGLISGSGNGFSTYLAWEKKKGFLIEKRLMNDLPKVVNNLNHLNEKVSSLYNAIHSSLNEEEAKALNEILEGITEKSFNEENEKEGCCVWRFRNVRNFIRVFTAAAFSFAGGALGGFYPKLPGIISGAFLSGFGNSLSTWLAYEEFYEKQIKRRAIKELPKLLKTLENSENNLLSLIEKIKTLQPEVLSTYKPNVSPPSILDDDCEKQACCDLYGMRALRNFTRINVATWMAAGGGWVASFHPNIPGIIFGSLMGAAANALSTSFAWENKSYKKIEKAGTLHFDKVILKVNEVSSKILALKTFIERANNGVDIEKLPPLILEVEHEVINISNELLVLQENG